MIAIVAAVAVLLAFAACWEAAGTAGPRVAARRLGALAGSVTGLRSIEDLTSRFGGSERLARAGLGERVSPAAFAAAKLCSALAAAAIGAAALPGAPARLAPLLGVAFVAAGFIAPDALAERIGRKRRELVVSRLPDALDLIAVGAAAGKSAIGLLTEISATGSDPLARELAVAIAEVDCGVPLERALESLRTRVPGAELGSLAAALERSRRYGSPLSDQLRSQAGALRRDLSRRIEERAARSAPKIQLVVALVLVPSVLLTIAAALIAHSDALFGSL